MFVYFFVCVANCFLFVAVSWLILMFLCFLMTHHTKFIFTHINSTRDDKCVTSRKISEAAIIINFHINKVTQARHFNT